ncbi:M20/M25/M40 family metallo-hydrolase [Flammeovirga yaeyamensis]|uniref:M20/M25/M40 family metallo-hydrolase n=1 Tax=Flammeovirga yaeyamensis TaxID=367791 RepID=A0AAX1NAB9_9BACT|nr:M20/M25/M40 family metallo-hydrolase [Flammeovirga yaeyamensis]MBB3697605.1 hypothetical protein [Flammeovirga yaeyamensis]NMF36295.1 M20/M25/M40 family metallo-hydrolase [Flammeovirga yaeyamensis]QWG03022.1 M20/M25/M40 family metallo-hydrolase [Flammeovirga yaeyamensis]
MRIVQTFILLFALIFSLQNDVKAQISVARTQEIVDTLASNQLRGRLAGSEGERLTTEYIKNEFEKLGLVPAGEDGTYFQNIKKFAVEGISESLLINKEAVKSNQFFIDTDVEEWASKKKKEFSVVTLKESENFNDKRKELMKSNQPTFVWVQGDMNLIAMKKLKNKLSNKEYLEEIDGARKIVWVEDIPASREKFKKLSFTFQQKIHNIVMRNVMARLEGSGPRAKETIMIGAHHDHIGILEPIQNDSIANGADDNASGVSAVLQLAEYFAKRRMKYPRSILFVTFTAEEMGLVGSEYMASQMSDEELKNIKAMINFEMIGKPSVNGKRKAYMTGYDQSTLGKQLAQTVLKDRINFKIFADPYEDMDLYFISDNASFVKRGVIAHTISSTDIDFDSYYHTVNDEAETLNYQNIVDVIKGMAVGIEPLVRGRFTPRPIK